MRNRPLILATLAVAATSGTLLAVSPAPPAEKGTARDLQGTWTASDGSKVQLDHKSGGEHAVTGTLGAWGIVGTLKVGKPLASGDVFADLTWGAKAERYIVAKDCTRLVSATRTLVRAVPADHVRLRVVTYNIRGVDQRTPDDLKDFARIIKAQNADIVALQEIKAVGGFLGSLLNQARLIAHYADYDFVYASAHRGVFDEGEAVLVNRKGPNAARIVSDRGVTLPRGPGVDPKKDLSRVALVTEIELKGGKRIQTICTHTSSSFEASRVVQSAEVLKLTKAPSIVMGDFNAAPGAGSMKDLRAKLLDVFPAANPADPGFTSNPLNPHARIDYIFLARSGRGRVLSSWTLDSPGPQRGNLKGHRSDHLGLAAVVDVELK